jgi:hypothetical protein
MKEQTPIPPDIAAQIKAQSAKDASVIYDSQTESTQWAFYSIAYIEGATQQYIASIQREKDAIMLFFEHLDTHYFQDNLNVDMWHDGITGNQYTREQVYEIYLSLSINNSQ